MKRGNCRECIFWRRDAADNYSGMADCRRYPPTSSKEHSHGGTIAQWVKTEPHNWCGEWVLYDGQH